MSEPSEQDHWAVLASELGTPPPPPKKALQAESEAEQAAPSPSPAPQVSGPGLLPKPPARQRKTHAPPPTRTASGWADLAGELGLEVPVEMRASPPPAPVAPPLAVPEPEEGPPAPPSEESWGAAGWDEEVRPDAEPAEPWTIPPASEAEEPRYEERSGRRRRRRRRPRPEGFDRTEARPFEPAGGDEDDTELEGEASQDHDWTEDQEAVEIAAPDLADEAGARSKRRRRRRRRPSEDRGAAPGMAEEEMAVARAAVPPPGTRAGDEAEEAVDDEADDETADDDSELEHGEKIVHRGVPTWKEAVDVLIAANLESRARRPDRGPPGRDRGNRNHRRGR